MWIASQMKEIFLEVVRMVHFLSEVCTDASCPRMCAGPPHASRVGLRGDSVEYRWAEEDGPKSMPAAKYMHRLLEDVDVSLVDEALLPRDGSPMPPHLRPTLSTMLRRLFRVYAHACAKPLRPTELGGTSTTSLKFRAAVRKRT